MTAGKLAKWGLILIGIWLVIVAVATVATRDLWLIDVLTPVGILLVLAGAGLLISAIVVKVMGRTTE